MGRRRPVRVALPRCPRLTAALISGVVESSSDERFKSGDLLLFCRAELSETVDGGYAEFARVTGDVLMPLPAGLNPWEDGALGTAGFTAAVTMRDRASERPVSDLKPA